MNPAQASHPAQGCTEMLVIQAASVSQCAELSHPVPHSGPCLVRPSTPVCPQVGAPLTSGHGGLVGPELQPQTPVLRTIPACSGTPANRPEVVAAGDLVTRSGTAGSSPAPTLPPPP